MRAKYRGAALSWALLAGLAMSASNLAVAADAKVGGLSCDTIEGTGLNLIFHSSTDVRCTFKDDAGSEQWYMGETGMAIGIDLKWNKVQNIYLGVISSTQEYAPEGDFLTGSYGGAKAEAAVGAGAGVQVLVGGSGDTIALQPAVETSQGAGVAAGLGYLELKPDPAQRGTPGHAPRHDFHHGALLRLLRPGLPLPRNAGLRGLRLSVGQGDRIGERPSPASRR